ncbi:ABC transporter ATP-binding protein [Danxiaibacter flavus]|uniref:ABC transporter ATP-binding protein n=1 Tax=Danxiaibacter flavus TaxID=3049108 RepID=A0ABV3ZI18_9BACT|nr:ABC transporter ATP-binding protein [Chitinophagaceae bacterium DXS]
MSKRKNQPGGKPKQPGLSVLLKPYRSRIVLLIAFALAGNVFNLWIPKIIGQGIDSYTQGHYVQSSILIRFAASALLIFLFSYLQSVAQTYSSERVAKDLREKLSDKISQQSYTWVQQSNPSKLLTNLTADVDSIKMYVSTAIASIASSVFMIIGASILLLTINWRLALIVLTIIPIISFTFFTVLKRVRSLFIKGRGIIDTLNKTISESILGAALIRVLNSQQLEFSKFVESNTGAKENGFKILNLFAIMIPVVVFTANMAGVAILGVGGHFVIAGTMTLGDFAAFNNYLMMLVFPIFVLGFMSNIIAQAGASYTRISSVLQAQDIVDKGTIQADVRGDIVMDGVNLSLANKPVLKDVSFSIKSGTHTAITGPTASGKTQLLNLMIGLLNPDDGKIYLDNKPLEDYRKDALHQQMGIVFQDSIVFNMSMRENIAFNQQVTPEAMQKAIATAELEAFASTLPQGLDTIVSERGTSLSGGQKQRMMLARALAIEPKVLLLDDFTARVDTLTEQKILANIKRNYPGITVISVTQKISSAENSAEVILLMEGEVIASGTHGELLQTCPEYIQIYQSQRSTGNYEL